MRSPPAAAHQLTFLRDSELRVTSRHRHLGPRPGEGGWGVGHQQHWFEGLMAGGGGDEGGWRGGFGGPKHSAGLLLSPPLHTRQQSPLGISWRARASVSRQCAPRPLRARGANRCFNKTPGPVKKKEFHCCDGNVYAQMLSRHVGIGFSDVYTYIYI